MKFRPSKIALYRPHGHNGHPHPGFTLQHFAISLITLYDPNAYSSMVLAHFGIDNFPVISVNGGALSDPWEYVRKVDSGSDTLGLSVKTNPIMNVYKNNIRCAWGADKNGKGVKTLQVNDGDTLTFYPTRPSDKENDKDESSKAHLSAGISID